MCPILSTPKKYSRMGRNASGSSATARQSKPKIQTEDEYLGSLGLASPISDYLDDKWKVPHGMTASQEKKYKADAEKAAQEYQQKRADAREEYKALVKAGKIVPPSKLYEAVKACTGHPDHASVQAAKRVLKKRFNITYSVKLAKQLGIKTYFGD